MQRSISISWCLGLECYLYFIPITIHIYDTFPWATFNVKRCSGQKRFTIWTLLELVLLKITATDLAHGCATHLFTTITDGTLWWVAWSTRQVDMIWQLTGDLWINGGRVSIMHNSFCSLLIKWLCLTDPLNWWKYFGFFIRGLTLPAGISGSNLYSQCSNFSYICVVIHTDLWK